jgi:hypothetical protein
MFHNPDLSRCPLPTVIRAKRAFGQKVIDVVEKKLRRVRLAAASRPSAPNLP